MGVEQFSLSGYDDRKELLAQRYNRAGKSLFVIALPLHLIPTHMPIPDPAKAFEGNRTVNVKHASDFALYWRQNDKWATPPLLLDTTYPLAQDFEPRAAVGGVEFGVVRLPHNSAVELQILDGQHRILGWKLAADQISEELRRAREAHLRATESGDPIAAQIASAKLTQLGALQERLRREYVTVEILEGVTLDDHKQYFNDIAVNAKGISKSLTTSFDKRSVVNRVAVELAEQHRLLIDMVDFEVDRVAGRNEHLVSGRNVADVIRAVTVGIGSSWTRRKEESVKEAAVQQVTERFLDALVECFSDLREVAEGDLHPTDLRERSLLGSPTILRALAGAYHELAVDESDESSPVAATAGDAKARALFDELAPTMGLPIDPAWFATGFFPERSSKAPSSRSQDLKGLAALLTSWGRVGGVFTTGSLAARSGADAWS
ncbi:DNA sulfur modification protein DndB [Cellulomonas sp. HZM]|uniref:DNA sulfur modification protein DndB n=1 Tax=Cellulomonas sp. HZM TaxID=1454010 RepID=UPI000492F0B3|nr:DNA sulfur modification protein DndB [Cellulomonas sp. HZM]